MMPASMSETRLITAASEHCADLLYACGFFAPDAFSWVGTGKKGRLLLNDLEIDRARRTARVDAVDSLGALEKRLRKRGHAPDYALVLSEWLKGLGIRSVVVPRSYPLGLARDLSAHGISVRAADGEFWPERAVKTPAEVRKMQAATGIAEAGMGRGIEVLKQSKPDGAKRLVWKGRVLTAEILRAEMDSEVLRVGGVPGGTIVASGRQACDPHERGSGVLRANQLIILDIFPRDASTGYFGDLTRTVVRGRASVAQRKLWETCLEGQEFALAATRPGANGAEIHEKVRELFAAKGYPTERHAGRWRGFFHGTGHGLGLEIHESPRYSVADFQPGLVITVEPGIYWPGIGGVRHEDVVVVTPRGCRRLSKFPKELDL